MPASTSCNTRSATRPTTRRHALLGAAVITLTSALWGCTQQPSDADILERIKMQAQGFAQHERARSVPVYVFFDPQCGHCQTLWESSKALTHINFQWVPVSLFKGSAELGARILGAADPAQAFETIKSGSKAPYASTLAATPDPESIKLVQENTALLRDVGASGVPYLVSTKRDGSLLRVEGALATSALQQRLGL